MGGGDRSQAVSAEIAAHSERVAADGVLDPRDRNAARGQLPSVPPCIRK